MKEKGPQNTGGHVTLSPTTKPENLPSYLDFAVLTGEGAIELEILEKAPIVLYMNRNKMNRFIE